jgi:hypothetical protein
MINLWVSGPSTLGDAADFNVLRARCREAFGPGVAPGSHDRGNCPHRGSISARRIDPQIRSAGPHQSRPLKKPTSLGAGIEGGAFDLGTASLVSRIFCGEILSSPGRQPALAKFCRNFLNNV